MLHLSSLEQAKLDTNSFVTIGVFDGVHLGHQNLIQQLVEQARNSNRKSVVITFFPHPDKVLSEAGKRYYLTTPQKRADLILQLGVDIIITLPFDSAFRRLPAADFVAQLVTHLRVKELWVGADFALGYQREGDVRFLKTQGQHHGFAVTAVELITAHHNQLLIRSSSLRNLVRSGDITEAKALLGRSYSLAGDVVSGEQRGRTIGFPTANLAVWPEQIVPANGVYATWAILDKRPFMAATNIGRRPTFAGETVTVEAHLLDFHNDIYGENLELRFERRLRAEQKFDGPAELITQIQADITMTRQFLSASPPG